jgi:hypothetical protein
MLIIKRIFIFTLLVVCFSCEDLGWITDCNDCTQTEPDDVNLIIKLTSKDSPVKISVYEGEIEDSVLYSYAEIWGESYTPGVKLYKKYTVAAIYQINGNTYVAIDSANPKVKYTEDQCEKPCYFIYDRTIDLRLKYRAD